MDLIRSGNLVRSVLPEQLDKAQAQTIFSQIEKVLHEERPLGILLDASGTKKMTDEAREIAVRHMKTTKSLRSRWLRGEAVVLTSTLLRGMVAAIYVVAPPGYQARTFGDVIRAELWLKEVLR